MVDAYSWWMKPCNGVASARWRRAKRRCNSDVTRNTKYNKRDKEIKIKERDKEKAYLEGLGSKNEALKGWH